jgi:hypothetical protein
VGINQIKAKLSEEDLIKKRLVRDRLLREYNNTEGLRRSLVNIKNNYGSHPETGVIYDSRVLEWRLTDLAAEINAVNAELENV